MTDMTDEYIDLSVYALTGLLYVHTVFNIYTKVCLFLYPTLSILCSCRYMFVCNENWPMDNLYEMK